MGTLWLETVFIGNVRERNWCTIGGSVTDRATDLFCNFLGTDLGWAALFLGGDTISCFITRTQGLFNVLKYKNGKGTKIYDVTGLFAWKTI